MTQGTGIRDALFGPLDDDTKRRFGLMAADPAPVPPSGCRGFAT